MCMYFSLFLYMFYIETLENKSQRENAISFRARTAKPYGFSSFFLYRKIIANKRGKWANKCSKGESVNECIHRFTFDKSQIFVICWLLEFNHFAVPFIYWVAYRYLFKAPQHTEIHTFSRFVKQVYMHLFSSYFFFSSLCYWNCGMWMWLFFFPSSSFSLYSISLSLTHRVCVCLFIAANLSSLLIWLESFTITAATF